MRRVGVLSGTGADDLQGQADLAAFRGGLQKLGWTEGQNVRIGIRSASGNVADMRKNAVELVALAPDVILAIGSTTMGELLEVD